MKHAQRSAVPDAASADVLLVSMPFGPVFWPSLGLSLLQAGLRQHGITARVQYFTTAFAEIVGETLYSEIANGKTLSVREMAGEWIFTRALFGDVSGDVDRYVEEILTRRQGHLAMDTPVSAPLIARIVRARERAEAFLDACLAEVVAAPPRILGFTSVFQQHVASLALARRVKAALPGTVIVFGGANCEGVMGAETLRQFPWVDAVVSGEGDLVFPEFVRRVLDGDTAPVGDLVGVRTRATIDGEFCAGVFPSAAPVRNLDALPIPDYRDYFAAFRASRFDRDWQPGVFVETSRGCWWGERMHCTFCGLNGATMTFRSKSAPRALAEMTALSASYPGADMQVVDNILDLEYFKTLLPDMAARKLDFGLFFETKSNLKKPQIELLRAAGVRTIQPGIESLSDAVLQTMRKGVTALHNIQVLKWCKEFGVEVLWSVLWGFPGEPPAEYDRMARQIPLLAHLPPPLSSFGLRLDRFSPNFADSERLGFGAATPLSVYSHLYPLPDEARANLAYYFGFTYSGVHPRTYVGPLLAALARWRRAHAKSDLFSVDVGDARLVWDLRPGARSSLSVLRDTDRIVYEAADAVCNAEQLIEMAAAIGGSANTADAVNASLVRFENAGLMLHSGKRFLSLAVPLGDYQPPASVLARFDGVARRSGCRSRRRPGVKGFRRLTAGNFSFDRQGGLVIH